MAASYPSSIKSFSTKTDNVDDVLAAHVNDIQDEITAIETELGTNAKQKTVKGWANFSGTGTPTLQDSNNVTSITDNGTGDYTVTWDTDFANANYSVSVNVVGNTGDVNNHGIVKFGGMATGSTRVLTGSTAGNSPADYSNVLVMAIGDQ